jgi:hypothetical protein
MSEPKRTSAPDAAPQPFYDAAISFRVTDEATAKAIYDQLTASGLKVFFFPRQQEKLAGTDGMESMKAPFIGARVNIVLFREDWGKTPWTHVEETAIKERCLSDGWSSLMFVQLDSSTVPKWVPRTHIRFAMKDYGIDQLVGAIKMRVQEAGGTIRKLDAMAEAQRVATESRYLAERKAMLTDGRWVAQCLGPAIGEVLHLIVAKVAEVREATGIPIEAASGAGHVVMTDRRISVAAGWTQKYFGNVEQEAYFWVREFSGPIALPGERLMYVHEPKLLREHRFTVDISVTRELCWAKGKERISADDFPDRIIKILLDLVLRANQGKVEMPPIG